MSTQIPNSDYDFKWNPRPSYIPRYILLCVVCSAISIVLSYFGVMKPFTVPGVSGASVVYPASVFYALCTYWFGGWGLIASYIGAFLGSGVLAGVEWKTALLVGVADILEPLVPFLLLRQFGPRLGISPLGENILSKIPTTIVFLVFGAVLPPFISGLWGSWFLAGPGEFWKTLYAWWIGAAVLLAVFVPAICRIVGRTLRKKDLACRGIWS